MKFERHAWRERTSHASGRIDIMALQVALNRLRHSKDRAVDKNNELDHVSEFRMLILSYLSVCVN